MYLSATALALHVSTGIPFVLLVKLSPILADVGIALCLAWIVSPQAGALYAVNPVSVLVTAYHGQFDSIPLLALVLAWAALERRHMDALGTLLGIAILVKTWPVLLVPTYVSVVPTARARLRVLALACGVPAVWTLTWCAFTGTSVVTLLRVTAGYSSVSGWWGLGLLLKAPLVTHASQVAILVAIFLITFRGRTWFRPSAVLTLLAFDVLSVGFSVQYLLWIVPFMLLESVSARLLAGYTLLAVTAILSDYLLDGVMYGHATWRNNAVTLGLFLFLFACLSGVLAWSLWRWYRTNLTRRAQNETQSTARSCL